MIQNVDLTKTNLVIRRQFDVQITDGSTATITADPGEVFLPFDEERYSLINDVGELEVLSVIDLPSLLEIVKLPLIICLTTVQT